MRWADAYEALESEEAAYPVRGPDGERLRLANAMVDGEPPQGMPTTHRLHPVGTLAHLRYEAVGPDGLTVSTTEVRALVPSLPAFGEDAPGAPFGRVECPRRCREELAESGAMAIARGGAPGLSPEWVLRMPVGRAFDLRPQSITLQDLEDRRPISFPLTRYRVTLLEACPAKVRVGTVTSLEFHPNATVPIPQGFRARHWVQVDGCATLLKKRPSRPEPPAKPAPVSAQAPEYAYVPPKLEVIVPRRDSPLGRAILVVDEATMIGRAEPLQVRFKRVCRHDRATNRWTMLPLPEEGLEVAGPGLMNRVRVAYRFPEGPGLYWAEWSEALANDPGSAHSFAVVIQAGASVACREGELPRSAPGEISLCVPGHGPAEPRTVADPASSCMSTMAVAR